MGCGNICSPNPLEIDGFRKENNMGLVDGLCKLPATDCNFLSALNQATKAQIQLAVKIMQMSPNGNNKTRIEACERKLKSFDKAEEKPKKEEKPANGVPISERTKKEMAKPVKWAEKMKEPMKIVEFPAEKPKIKELAKSTEKHTYAECVKKMVPVRLKYKDDDNKYVQDGLLRKCEEDQDFRNNFMLPEKTYDGFYEYMFKAAMAGYCVKVGNSGGMLTKEKALDLAFDYYNMLEVIKPEEKKEVAKKLTTEVNKIADEVKQKTVEAKQKVEEIKPKKDDQIPGQLKFDF